jgi:SPP1 family predicted phage head-tail adaptor
VDIGKLNCLVEVQARAIGQDATGRPNGSWVPHASLWANIRQETGAEFIRADRDASKVKASIRIRRRLDITAAMRVVYGGTVYRILAVLQDPTGKQHTDLVCETP